MNLSAISNSLPLMAPKVSTLEAVGGRAIAARQQAAGAGGAHPPGERPAAYQELEAFVLQSFIETMLPDGAANVFGKGTAGEIWKSMMAEQLAGELARSNQVRIFGDRGTGVPAPAQLQAGKPRMGTPADLLMLQSVTAPATGHPPGFR